jgi:hypothetical protein
MALPPTRLTTLLYQTGSDPDALARVLLSERLVERSRAAELPQFIRALLDKLALEPPRPGPTWADRLSAALEHDGFLNKSGMVWVRLDPPDPPLPAYFRWMLIATCSGWSVFLFLAAMFLLFDDVPAWHLPRWYGGLLLLGATSSAVAAFAMWRRLRWAPHSMLVLAGVGVKLLLTAGALLWRRCRRATCCSAVRRESW